tara:strand:+ start:227 stop:460 length:234 start_codon:yes stop_codon:yes gene_type:complete
MPVEIIETISRIALSLLIMGNEKFNDQIESLTGQPARFAKTGRPAKNKALMTSKYLRKAKTPIPVGPGIGFRASSLK